ncbi:MAG: metal-dependent hydrolase [Pseudomonadota bacterium]
MDTITHSLLGALVVRSVFPAQQSRHPFSNRQRLLAGAIAGAFPDIDYIASWVDPMIYLTLWHRSITHSFVMLPLWALLAGITLSFVFRQRQEWRYLSMLAGVAMLSHIASDLITVYGTQVLAPLSSWRASIGITFIIDPWFTLIVLIGFITGYKSASHRLPYGSLAVLLAYVLFQGGLKQHALSIAQDHVHRESISAVRVAAFPQPFSPFNWKIIIETDDYYDISYVNLSGGYATTGVGMGFWDKVRNTYQTPEQMIWQRQMRFGDADPEVERVEMLWHNEQLDCFRRFAELPVLYRIDQGMENSCVWFTDLRYVLPYMTPPFIYGLCQKTRDTIWELNRLRD